MKKALVTGGSGLIGQFLLQQLQAEGYEVSALYRNTIPQVEAPGITWVEGDILDPVLLRSLMAKVQAVYHCAGFVSYAPQDKDLLQQINVEGTANVVDACLQFPGVALCHVSSIAAVNRKKGDTIITEEAKWDPGEERSAYAFSKYAAEVEVWRGISEGLQAVIVNPSIVLGPADWNRSSTQLFKYAWQEHAFYTLGYANFVDVRDVVKAMTLLMEGGHWGNRFILNAHQITYQEFFERAAQCFGKKPPTIKVAGWLTEVLWRLEALRGSVTGAKPLITKDTARVAKERHFFSNEKVKKALGMEFRPLEETLDWCCLRLKQEIQKADA
ncbi:NAD-dependent epimerase/dehydratase family protein [Nibribacter ruber]|uniref:NAD-dependent epimerase/dehydratase family protein n=1 Tax=Nibribacter ruber TaxID=2698458 RepID=A0A6P1P2R0_9BACT|nr:NAD-dependent epimerase/dehydratase family protein [Nibribacter ruber]QHL88663.1 NAD-dependent epimerase/dehydratase family protein [Nibribacter ruber]